PALTLLVRTEQADAAHREAGMDAVEGVDRTVAFGEFVLDQPHRQRVKPGAAIAANHAADDSEVAQPKREIAGKFGAIPIGVDLRQNAGLHVIAHPVTDGALVIVEEIVELKEVN